MLSFLTELLIYGGIGSAQDDYCIGILFGQSVRQKTAAGTVIREEIPSFPAEDTKAEAGQEIPVDKRHCKADDPGQKTDAPDQEERADQPAGQRLGHKVSVPDRGQCDDQIPERFLRGADPFFDILEDECGYHENCQKGQNYDQSLIFSLHNMSTTFAICFSFCRSSIV